MKGPRSLAIIINQVEDDSVFTLSNDEIPAFVEKCLRDPEVQVALARLNAFHASGDDDELTAFAASPSRTLH